MGQSWGVAVGEGRTRRETPRFRPQSPAIEVSVNPDELMGDLEGCKQGKDVSWVQRMKSGPGFLLQATFLCLLCTYYVSCSEPQRCLP